MRLPLLSIRLATNFASKSSNNLLDTTHDNASDFTSDSEYSTDSQHVETEGRQRQKIPVLSLTLLHAFESIGLLYHYSSIFRRPRLGGRYLHSKAKDAAPDIPYYEFSHVQQKLKEWRQPATIQSEAKTLEDEDKSTNLIENTQAPPTSSTPDEGILCLRLSAANARRRDQLRYWNGHPFRVDQDSIGHEPPGDVGPAEIQSIGHISENRSYKSNPTVHTFSSVARSAIFESDGIAGASRTTYAESTVGDSKSAKRLPAVPQVSKNSASFECPFCHMTLESGAMQDRNTWK